MNFEVGSKMIIYGMKYFWVTFRRTILPIVQCVGHTPNQVGHTMHLVDPTLSKEVVIQNYGINGIRKHPSRVAVHLLVFQAFYTII